MTPYEFHSTPQGWATLAALLVLTLVVLAAQAAVRRRTAHLRRQR